MRALLISNSGRPFLGWCRPLIAEFLGSAKTIAFVTAANLGDERLYHRRAREALEAAPPDGVGVTVLHCDWQSAPLRTLYEADAVFVGGGNTYALLDRLRRAGVLGHIRDRVRGGLPYLGASAGANIAGPNILTTNDWNVVGLGAFDALGLVPFNINPHYLQTDPAMAQFSETRDDRIAEYHVVNANAVVGIEEGTAVRVDDGLATVAGRGRVKLFRRGVQPVWVAPDERLPL
jgi:dipeptidase E